MITIQNLTKVFRTEEVETSALSGISLEIKKGDFLTIMGPSGCGKSTLLNIIGLLDSATNGSYKLLDQEMIGLKEKGRAKVRKENIGFIFQNFNLIDELSVYDNIELPLLYNNVKASDRKQKIEAIAEKLNISHRLKHFPQQLSGGQQQRVAVARALVNDPKIILADEPTGNLDEETGTQVMSLLADLAREQNRTLLIVTHSREAASYADRILRLSHGQLVPEQ